LNIIFNGDKCVVEDRITVAALLERFEFEPRLVAVEVNWELAPRSSHGQRALAEGDRVEVVTLAGGG
jgi:sulfur carrier protein